MKRKLSWEWRWFLGMIETLVMVRLIAILMTYYSGFPDQHLYLAYADMILTDSSWLHQLEVDPLPVTGFRAVGYPLILAGAKLLAGYDFSTLVQCLQATMTVIACAMLFRAVMALLPPSRWAAPMAAMSALGFGLSVNLAYEVSLLPDSLLISAWILIMSIALRRWLLRRPLTPLMGLGLGLLALLIVMTRGNGLHLLLLTVPVVALACLQPGLGKPIRALAMLLVYLPGFLAYQAVSEWNQGRTGERFFTTGAQIALVQPVFRMEEFGAAPFDGDDLLRRTIREQAPERLYEQIYTVNQSLYIDHGVSAKQIADANIALYLDTVAHYPDAFGKMFLSNFDEKLAIGVLNPAFGLHEAYFLTTGERLYPGFSKILKQRQDDVTTYLYAAIYAVGMVASLIIFAVAVLVAPIRAAFRRVGRDTIAVLCLWLVSMAVLAYYAALFMELRYVIMVTPFLSAIGFWALHRRSTPPEE